MIVNEEGKQSDVGLPFTDRKYSQIREKNNLTLLYHSARRRMPENMSGGQAGTSLSFLSFKFKKISGNMTERQSDAGLPLNMEGNRSNAGKLIITYEYCDARGQ